MLRGDKWGRRRRTWIAAVGSAVLVGAAVALVGVFRNEPDSNRVGQILRGAVLQEGHTWRCRGRVDLKLVRVTMHGEKGDAVHLNRGCTGVIERLEIPGDGANLGPSGDGVKIHAGAHDLRILAGFINCGQRSPRKHQDAIQAMAGKRVTFVRIESRGCANSFMFINWGRGRREKPEDVVCKYCRAKTRNFSVSVRNSVRSGALGGEYVSRAPPSATVNATEPVLENNAWRRRRSLSR